MTDNKCTKCGIDNPAGESFCQGCGARLGVSAPLFAVAKPAAATRSAALRMSSKKTLMLVAAIAAVLLIVGIFFLLTPPSPVVGFDYAVQNAKAGTPMRCYMSNTVKNVYSFIYIKSPKYLEVNYLTLEPFSLHDGARSYTYSVGQWSLSPPESTYNGTYFFEELAKRGTYKISCLEQSLPDIMFLPTSNYQLLDYVSSPK